MASLNKKTVSSDLERLGSSPAGCKLWRVDLHTHTPASSDSRWKQGVTAHEIVAAYAGGGISLIAITDHSTAQYVDDMKSAAKSYSKRNKTQFNVLPGVEIYAEGVHLTAIFPETTSSQDITLFLGRLGLKKSDFGKEGVLVDMTISSIAGEVRKEGGLLVGAHCNSSRGIVNELDGRARTVALKSVDYLELRADQSDKQVEKTVTYVRKQLGLPNMPFVFSSDAHSETEIQESVSLIKMDAPTFSGVKQLLHEPHLRSPGREPPGNSITRILGVVVDDGIYKNTALQLSRDLNVIVGGRGAGKSALVDIIRFVLDFEAIVGGYQEAVDKRLAGFFEDGDEVRLYVEANGDRFCIRRTMDSFRTQKAFEITSSPEVYLLRKDGPLRERKHPSSLLDIDIYGQGEVLQLADRAEDQLTLLDTFVDLSDIDASISERLSLLQENSASHFEALEEKAELEDAISRKGDMKARIAELDQHLGAPVFRENESWERQKHYVSEVQDALSAIAAGVTHSPLDNVVEPAYPADETKNTILQGLSTEYESLVSGLTDLSDKQRQAFAAAQRKIEKQISGWQERYEAAKKSLEEELHKLGLREVKHAYEERSDLKADLKKIEKTLEPKLKGVEKKIEVLQKEREAALKQLNEQVRLRSEARLQAAKDINEKLPPNIQLEVRQLGNLEGFFGFLDQSVFARSGIRSRARHIHKIIEAFSPLQLATLIRSKNTGALEKAGLTADAALKIVSAPEEAVRSIEEVLLDDLPIFSLRREGETKFVPLDELSLGEKCSAILSVLLVSEGRPLVIDEPEAELDHDFICNDVVESMRSVKGMRQIVTCTHNPNIPVLGDAEMIVKVSKLTGKAQCVIDHSGGFEHPDSLRYLKQLEGGEDALRRRSEKYELF